MKILELDENECNMIYGSGHGCYSCDSWVDYLGWVDAGIWCNTIMNGKFYSGADICRLTAKCRCSTYQYCNCG